MSQETVRLALQKAIGNIRDKGGPSRLVFRAQTQWEQDVRCSARVRDFRFDIDEPPELGGGDAGANPVELLLVALGACQEIVYSAYASVLGIPLESVRVDVKGQLDLKGLLGIDEAVLPGYQKVSYETTISSPADEATIRGLVSIVERHCPVLDTLSRPVPVSGCVKVNGALLAVA